MMTGDSLVLPAALRQPSFGALVSLRLLVLSQPGSHTAVISCLEHGSRSGSFPHFQPCLDSHYLNSHNSDLKHTNSFLVR